MGDQNNLAFVISRIGNEDSPERRRADEIFEFVIEPVAEERGLHAWRSDHDPTPGQVTAQLVKRLTAARVVIADVTGRNPNVYYELGIAHSFAKPVVMLVDDPASLPFDTAHERVITVGKDDRLAAADANRAKASLSKALDVVLADGYEPSSLVRDAAGTQSLDALAPGDPVAEELANLRDRLDVVVRQTANIPSADYQQDAATMYRILTTLGQHERIDQEFLKGLGQDLDKVALRDDIRRGLKAAIPKDDPIPF